MKLSKKAQTSKTNGALSRGPKTPEGKLRSCMNALRHGMLAKSVLLPSESPAIFNLLLEENLAKFRPDDGPEHSAVEQMVACIWRQRRLWAVETHLWSKAMDDCPDSHPMDKLAGALSDLAARPVMQLIHRYDTRLDRMYQRALQNLFLLSDSDPGPDEPPAVPEPEPVPEIAICQTNPSADNPNPISRSEPTPTPAPPADPFPFEPSDVLANPDIFLEALARLKNGAAQPKKPRF